MSTKFRDKWLVFGLTMLAVSGCSAPADKAQTAGNATVTGVVVTQPSETTPTSSQVSAAQGEVVLRREPDGHFYTEARVNGMPLRFMVDTGATTIALAPADAQAMGMQFDESEFNEVGRGVGGEIPMKRIRLETVEVGNFKREDVEAVIVNSDLQVSLLGQNWLSTIGNVTIKGEEMILR